ncbi:MAG: MmcQ/YjbR family DNA-binding protein [Saprospiraceae bacterium]|nr:MmcQ/YjbR family DNA-binding protein [Saprospiraceae bacterium]
MTIDEFKKIANSFPETSEEPHFEKISFRVNRKIFATLSEKDHRVTLKLSVEDQDVFALFDKVTIYPVPNKWGKQGWTFVDLDKAKTEIVQDMLKAAYCAVAPKRLVELFGNEVP